MNGNINQLDIIDIGESEIIDQLKPKTPFSSVIFQWFRKWRSRNANILHNMKTYIGHFIAQIIILSISLIIGFVIFPYLLPNFFEPWPILAAFWSLLVLNVTYVWIGGFKAIWSFWKRLEVRTYKQDLQRSSSKLIFYYIDFGVLLIFAGICMTVSYIGFARDNRAPLYIRSEINYLNSFLSSLLIMSGLFDIFMIYSPNFFLALISLICHALNSGFHFLEAFKLDNLSQKTLRELMHFYEENSFSKEIEYPPETSDIVFTFCTNGLHFPVAFWSFIMFIISLITIVKLRNKEENLDLDIDINNGSVVLSVIAVYLILLSPLMNCVFNVVLILSVLKDTNNHWDWDVFPWYLIIESSSHFCLTNIIACLIPIASQFGTVLKRLLILLLMINIVLCTITIETSLHRRSEIENISTHLKTLSFQEPTKTKFCLWDKVCEYEMCSNPFQTCNMENKFCDNIVDINCWNHKISNSCLNSTQMEFHSELYHTRYPDEMLCSNTWDPVLWTVSGLAGWLLILYLVTLIALCKSKDKLKAKKANAIRNILLATRGWTNIDESHANSEQ